MSTDCSQQLTFWDLGTQQVTVDFQGGRVVTDTRLLPLRLLDKDLGVLATIAPPPSDPRAQKFVSHTREALLTQEVYQILAGYADGNDAQVVRQDPLFQTLVDVSPDGERLLASGSTLNRFHHAYTRRQAGVPVEERPVLREVDAAQSQRVQIFNAYLPELFIRTRRERPLYVILDIDPSDDPMTGLQVFSFFPVSFSQY